MSEEKLADYSQEPPLDSSPAVLQRIAEKIDSGFSDHFMVCDLERVRQRFDFWQQQLPRVQPFYAVKCNNDPRILELLASLGCGFDCASWPEIETALSLVEPDNIIFANPCKQQSHVTKARENNVPLIVFDNSDELAKISELYPEAQCVLRLATDDKDAVCQLSCKFGAQIREVPSLLAQARAYDLDVVGVSFHCGSGNANITAYQGALDDSYIAFELAAQAGFNPKLLNIGGGFPGCSNDDDIFVDITNGMQFDDFDDDVRIIAEPGRFFVASAQTLATRVFALKQHANGRVYYINDGVYGSFNSMLYDHARPIARKFVAPDNVNANSKTPELFASTIFGPTCDGLDCVAKNVALPQMARDDWFIFDNMGAYTNVGGSEFNGMSRPTFEYVE